MAKDNKELNKAMASWKPGQCKADSLDNLMHSQNFDLPSGAYYDLTEEGVQI